MITVNRMAIAYDEMVVTLEELRAYVQFPSGLKDAELAESLLSAIKFYEDRFNVSLRAMTIELITESNENGVVKLYYPTVTEVAEVVSIDNKALDFSLNRASELQLSNSEDFGKRVIVVYNTKAANMAQTYRSAILGRASAIFNGSTDSLDYSTSKQWV